MNARRAASLAAAAISVLAIAAPAAAQRRPPEAIRPSEAVRASEAVRVVEQSALRVQRLLAATRDLGQTERIRCVDARLSEVHALLRTATERRERIEEAAHRDARDHAERDRRLIARLAEQARRLEREARACIDPEPDVAPGRTQVTVIIEPWVPQIDVAALPRRTN